MSEVALTRLQQAGVVGSLGATYFPTTAKMWLTVSTFVPTRLSTDADFIAAEVPNADINAIVLANGWATGVNFAGDGLMISLDLCDFLPAAATNLTISVGGFVIMDSGNTFAYAYGTFDTPFTFDSINDHLIVKANMTFVMTSNEDAEFIDGP